jgi:cardiolipin synthase A/B
MMHFKESNQVILLRSGTEYFPALEAAIDSAEQEIYLQTFIFEPDEIGVRIANALKRAATRGVAVCVLLDGYGCKDLPLEFLQDMRQAGVGALIYRPKISPWTFKRKRLRRLHSKLVVIDGSIAFVGGINIIDDFNTPDHMAPRKDYAVSIKGPLLVAMRASARQLWGSVSRASLHRLDTAKLPTEHGKPGDIRAAFVVRDNLWHRRDIEKSYLAAIRNAKSEIVIANSYFLPGIRFRRALIAARKRGVRVILLLQARVEYMLVDYAAHALYGQFLKADIEIHEYHASFMHSKVAVIDQHWATVGSSNIDPFSLLLARESNIVVKDAKFASVLRIDIQKSIDAGASLVSADDWQHGHIIRRSLSWIVYGLVRLALGVVGYPKSH